jgi:hypothetical protein
MSSLSLSRIPRRFQVALLAVVVFAVLWVAVLHKAGSGASNESAPPASTHAATQPGVAGRAGHGAAARHGSAAAGRGAASASHARARSPARAARASRGTAIAAAAHHGASAAQRSQGVAGQATQRGAPAGGGTSHAASRTGTSSPRTAASSRTGAPPGAGAVAAPRAPTAPATRAAAGRTGGAGSSSVLKTLESELGEGKVVLVLFWNPQAVTDQFVQRELQAASHSLGRGVAVQYARASQVGEYGEFAKKVLITETPTILVITPEKQVSALEGFNEAESIKRAVEEARAAGNSRP